MSVRIPAALEFDGRRGDYVVSDKETSGGDIGAQILLFPTVWVCHSMLRCACRDLFSASRCDLCFV